MTGNKINNTKTSKTVGLHIFVFRSKQTFLFFAIGRGGGYFSFDRSEMFSLN